MYRLDCEIMIGDKFFTTVSEVVIERSLHYMETATVKLPVWCYIVNENGDLVRQETSSAFKVSDSVVIALGYNGEMYDEFRGYVQSINYKKPVEILCWNSYYGIDTDKKKEVMLDADKYTLAELLRICEFKPNMGPDQPRENSFICEDMELENYVHKKYKISDILDTLRNDYKLRVFYDGNGTLNVLKNITPLNEGNPVHYDINENIISEDDWTFDGKKIKTFLQPFVEPGMIVDLNDDRFQDKCGEYLVHTTKVTFSQKGARRDVELETLKTQEDE